MNEEDETVAGNGDYQRELTELLNLLEAVDQQITPEHVNDRFTELLRDIDGTPEQRRYGRIQSHRQR